MIVDMINDLEFDGGDQLFEFANVVASNLRRLADRFRSADLPVIYANDNFGKWQSNFHVQVDHCLSNDVRGRSVVKQLVPQDSDYFVLKPKHSAFYATTVDVLLDYLGIETIVITGMATDICVLFSANDALHARPFALHTPRLCRRQLRASLDGSIKADTASSQGRYS